MSELVRDWKAEKKDLEDAFDIIADKLVKADAEIERLKAKISDLLVEIGRHCKTIDTQQRLIIVKDAEIARLNTVAEWTWKQQLGDAEIITSLHAEIEWMKKAWTDEVAAKVSEVQRLKVVIESQNRSIDKHLTLIKQLTSELDHDERRP